MSSSTLIILLLVIGPVLATVFMHRGAGTGGHYGDHGSHGRNGRHEPVDRREHGPVVGKRGETASVTAGEVRGKRARHGCH